LRGASGTNAVETVKAVLRSRDSEQHPVSRHWTNDDAPFTFGSVIMLLSERPEMLVTAGPPDQQEYRPSGIGHR
jgi:hypothetical protein